MIKIQFIIISLVYYHVNCKSISNQASKKIQPEIQEKILSNSLPQITEEHKSNSNHKSAKIQEKSKSNSDFLFPKIEAKKLYNYELIKVISSQQKEKKAPKSPYHDEPYILYITRKDKDSIGFSITMVNNFSGSFKKIGEDKLGDKFKTVVLYETNIAVYDMEKKNELFMINILSNIERVKFGENLNELYIGSPNGSLIFKRIQ